MKYERISNSYSEILQNLNDALDRFEQSQEEYRELSIYYGSEAYHEDWEEEKKGLYDEIPRGVLSEDGVYNLLSDHFEICVRMLELCAKGIKNR